MLTTMLKLLGRRSSINVRKVLWTCAELNLPVQQEDWGMGFRPTSDPAFTALNPNALVPVLIDGDFVLWESNTICRYLAARAQRVDLLPADAAGRARVEQWMDWQHTELNGAWVYAFQSLVRRNPAYQDAGALAASVANWNRHMAMLDAQLARTGGHAVGDGFTLADIALGLSTHRWLHTPITRAELPAVQAYYQRLCTRPAFVRHGTSAGP